MRLDKFLAQSSIGRRKDVRLYIKDGKVKVNEESILEPSMEINELRDIIKYNENIVKYVEKVYYMFNKPAGCVTATKDKDFKTVFDYFSDINTNGLFHVGRLDKDTEGLLLLTNDGDFEHYLMHPENHMEKTYFLWAFGTNGLFHVGRLDKDTEGLLLLTNDGDFEHYLMHPENHMEKTYFLWAFGTIDDEKIKQLESGLYIGKNEPITKPAKFNLYKQGGYKEFKEQIPVKLLNNIDSEKYNQPVIGAYLTISEGRKHQVKKMLKAVGCYVVYLERVAIGNVKLDNALERGQYRELSTLEVESLMEN